jgi:hypothetical protein
MSEDPLPRHASPSERWAVPVLLVAGALFIELIAATVQLVGERGRLMDLRAAQVAQVQQANKFREQLQSLGGETARLAATGDVAAKKIVDAMKQQGVTLTTDK